MNRRQFNLMALGSMLMPSAAISSSEFRNSSRFDISISQWSFHRAMFGASRDDNAKFKQALHSNPDEVLMGTMDPREITKVARELGVSTVDLVNVLWFGHPQDKAWLKEFKQRAKDDGISFKLLMCDETGSIGSSNAKLQKQAIENHVPWMEAAAELGCTQLRVNAYGDGTYLERLNQCAEGLSSLSEIGLEYGLEVLVENHGYQSNVGAWLAMLIEKTAHDNCGVFLDFDNFFMGGWNIEPPRWYDRYQGIMDLAPYAKGISAKAHDFDAAGRETTIDYDRCMDILFAANFQGTYSAEFEGDRLSEYEGSKKTIELFKRYQ